MAQLATSAVWAAKQELRRKLRSALTAMTEKQRQEEADVLTKKFLASEEYQSSKRISVYLSMPTEIDTEKILEDVFSSGRTCFIPRYEGANMDMLRVHSVEDINRLPKTKWNIKQPKADEERENALTSGGLDLILMPGLGFTKGGHRIGRGKGYYDSYLAKCVQSGFSPRTVGLAFRVQLCDSIPRTEKDMTVDRVIFPDDP